MREEARRFETCGNEEVRSDCEDYGCETFDNEDPAVNSLAFFRQLA